MLCYFCTLTFLLKKNLVLFLLSVALAQLAKAQYPNFSQFYSNRIYMNPAFAGADPGLRINLNYRRFWAAVPGQFQTFSATADMSNFSLAGGLGLVVMNSVEGEGKLRTTQIGAMYSYRLTILPRMFDIHLALQGNFLQKGINFGNLVFSDQLDPVYGQINPTKANIPGSATANMLDLGAGIMSRFNIRIGRKTRKMWSNTVGASFKHLNTPNESLIGKTSNLPLKMTVHYSALFNISKLSSQNKVYLSPNFIYEKQNKFSTFNFGLFALRAPLMVGVWYRNQKFLISGPKNDAIIANLGFRGENGDKSVIFQIGYSYDLTISKMLGSSGGSHELSILLEFAKAKMGKERSSLAKKRSRAAYNFNGPKNLPKIF